ncbi:MAG TPA: type II secretion system F family protein [Actinomycetes bacterium]|nr:type II secretion system F family protein [Actinomycetes bacterium]
MTALVVLCGAGFGAGLLLAALGWRGLAPRQAPAARPRPRDLDAARRRLLLAALGALAGGLLTRWPAGVLLGGLLGGAGPALFGAGRARQRAIARVEAIAVWTEMLRDLMAAASGLEEAIVASARTGVVPEPIRAEVTALAGRLQGRWLFREALQAFGDELANPSADRVVVALALARTERVKHLGEMLSALARATREHVHMRLRVETERARARASAQFITVFSLATVALLLVVSRSYLAPFGTPLGQLVLLLVAGVFTASYLWMQAMQRERPPLRLRLADAPARDRGGVP